LANNKKTITKIAMESDEKREKTPCEITKNAIF
jgi:hypothetical protein